MIEFLFETARTVVDYVLSGNADRYPNVRLIVPHCSGVIPLLVERVQLFAALNPESEVEPVIANLRRCFFDLAGKPSVLPALAVGAAQRIPRLVVERLDVPALNFII